MDYGKYLREDRLPVIWCSGCGHGTAIKALLRAIDRIGLDQDNTAVVSGIGCSSRATGYLDFNTLHTTHGRAIAFATGLKIAKPDMNVIVITGDGDATAIGGNHFIHAARRNIDLTVILLNNFIYGMTGGQASPTTPRGSKATTAPFGALDPCFDIGKLAAGAGASYVARCSVHQPVQADKMMEAAIRKEGFSLVEVFSPCPTGFGRRNGQRTGKDQFLWLKENAVPLRKADKMSTEELDGRVITGVMVDEDRPEYTREYQRLIDRLAEQRAAAAQGGKS
jgi:2-oxoglutarate/2-oxoacid ferredoxin oxidoreductase subunit beta